MFRQTALMLSTPMLYLKQQYRQLQQSWSEEIRTPQQRWLAHTDAFIADHAFFRLYWSNLSQIDKGVWRSNQPSPGRLKALRAEAGIRTVVNLRGPHRLGSYGLEQQACREAGIRLINHRMYSRRMPLFQELQALEVLFRSLEGPVLFHCKSGADRAGICAALYCLMIRKDPPETAIKQLSLRYLHIRWAKTGRLDYFLRAYQRFNASTPCDFMEWAEHHYDPQQLTRDFHSSRLSDWLTDRLLQRE